MKKLFDLFKKDPYQLHRSDAGIWMVKRDFSILYMGTKEKCEIYLSRLKAAA